MQSNVNASPFTHIYITSEIFNRKDDKFQAVYESDSELQNDLKAPKQRKMPTTQGNRCAKYETCTSMIH